MIWRMDDMDKVGAWMIGMIGMPQCHQCDQLLECGMLVQMVQVSKLADMSILAFTRRRPFAQSKRSGLLKGWHSSSVALETAPSARFQDIGSHSPNTGAGSIQRPNLVTSETLRLLSRALHCDVYINFHRSSGPTTTAWKGLQVGGDQSHDVTGNTGTTGTERIWQKFWQNGMRLSGSTSAAASIMAGPLKAEPSCFLSLLHGIEVSRL